MQTNLQYDCQCSKCCCDRLSDPTLIPTAAEKFIADAPSSQSHSDVYIEDNYWVIYGYAILNAPTVEQLKGFSPIVEVGAGTGYWAWELRLAGLDIVPTDPLPKHSFGKSAPWTQILRLTGPQAAKQYPSRNLLICWPDFNKTWPEETIKQFTGEYVLYAGEPEVGCTGTLEMFEELSASFTLEQVLEIPRFRANNDRLYVYKRHTQPPPEQQTQ